MYKFTDKSIAFIKKYLINEQIFDLPLNEDDIEKIIEYIVLNYETGLLDDNGDNPIPSFEQLQKDATAVVDEYSLHSEEDFDIDYLNQRLAQ